MMSAAGEAWSSHLDGRTALPRPTPSTARQSLRRQSGAEGSRTLDLLNAMHLTRYPDRPRACASVHHTNDFPSSMWTVAHVHGSSDSHPLTTPPPRGGARERGEALRRHVGQAQAFRGLGAPSG